MPKALRRSGNDGVPVHRGMMPRTAPAELKPIARSGLTPRHGGGASAEQRRGRRFDDDGVPVRGGLRPARSRSRCSLAFAYNKSPVHVLI